MEADASQMREQGSPSLPPLHYNSKARFLPSTLSSSSLLRLFLLSPSVAALCTARRAKAVIVCSTPLRIVACFPNSGGKFGMGGEKPKKPSPPSWHSIRRGRKRNRSAAPEAGKVGGGLGRKREAGGRAADCQHVIDVTLLLNKKWSKTKVPKRNRVQNCRS